MKKILLKAAVILLAIQAVSCGRKADAGKAAPASGKVDYSAHETFTAWLFADPYDEYSDYSDNPVVWATNKKFNVTLRFEQPPRGTESDSLSLMFGTGEYTDIIEMSRYTGSIPQLFADGVIVDIAKYLDYMPNLKRLLESDAGFRRASYNDAGQISSLRGYNDPIDAPFSGFMYRHDILEKAANGNVKFPSGEDIPTTIEDWEYMLPLMKSYFESAGSGDYACLIIPFNGTFGFGDLSNSFGAPSAFYIDGNKVKWGAYEEGFYKYLQKMRDWYAKGYIYKDFASRVNDPFYLPNTALTYGGRAGLWFGIGTAQVGSVMSMPQYNLIVDVRAIPSPLNPKEGITETANFAKMQLYDMSAGWAVTAKCKNIPKLLSIMDYFYSKEGEYLKVGLSTENGAAENPVYVKAGLQKGFYWMEGDRMVVNPDLTKFNKYMAFNGTRLPGLNLTTAVPGESAKTIASLEKIWNAFPNAKHKALPLSVSRTPEEDAAYANVLVNITDYMNSQVSKFIMGTTPLNDQAWAAYKNQLRSFGMDEVLRIQQAAYDRYLKR